MILKTKDIINIRRMNGNVGLTYNGDIFFSYRVSLPEVYSLSDVDYDEMSFDLNRYSKSLPNGIIEHWQTFSIRKQFDSDGLLGQTFLQTATREYFKGREYNEFDVYLFIVIPFNNELRSKFSISALRDKWENLSKEVLNINDRKRIIDNSISVLNSSKYFRATPLDEQDIKEIITNLVTGFNRNTLTDINFSPFQIGDNYFNCYAVNSLLSLPEKIVNYKKDGKMTTEKSVFYKSFLHSLYIELPYNHIANMFIYHQGHDSIKGEIAKHQEDFNTWSAWSSFNENGKNTLKNYLDTLEEDETIKLCRAHFNVFTFDKNPKRLAEIDNQVVTAFSELDIKPYKPIVDDQVAYYLCSIAGNAGFLPKDETFVSNIGQSLCFLPMCGNYKEDKHGILLNDRLSNKPIYKDFWDKPYKEQIITARNFAVIADTGRGKSFLTTHIYRTYLEMDYSLVLCDIGHSNETLAKLYKEKVNYVEFKEGQGIGINPFSINSASDLTSEKIESLNNFISIHWKKDSELDQATRVSLNFIIEDYYRNSTEKHGFIPFYRYVKKENWNLLKRLDINPEFFNIDEFLHICSEYDKGIYDFLYNGSGEEISIDEKPAIFFEFSNILKNPVILPIMSLMVRDAIETKIWGNSERKKVLVWEEAAKILDIPGQLKAIEYTAQTVRKYNASQGLIIQTIDNIPENEMGKAILTNTHTYWLFEQTKGLRSLINRLNLHDHAVDLLKSVRSNVKGKNPYTEFAVMLDQLVNVYRLETPREAYWTYVSDKDLKAMLYKEIEKTGDIQQAIINMVNYENRTN
ncbi:MAG TPA: TraG family conjugative transposon ATPase [Tenuifilaceae bacterium]|nr:TraG family conjugative transposon ATPase [Tenuifilaceae bacterium]